MGLSKIHRSKYNPRHLRAAMYVVVTILLGQANVAASKSSPVVVVFEVEDRTGRLAAAQLSQLTEYLRGRIGEKAAFTVVPQSQVKALLSKAKNRSYKACYDRKCQIEIGRELAAQKTLTTQILNFGSRCAVVVTLFDLRLAAADQSATIKGGCGQDALVDSVDNAIVKLKQAVLLTQASGQPESTGATTASSPNTATSKKPVLASKPVKPAKAQSQSPKPATDGDGEAATVAAIRAKRRSKTLWGYTALGVGAATIVTAAVLYGVGVSKGSSAHDDYLAATIPATQKDAQSDIESGRSMVLAGNVMMGVGALATAASIYLLLTRPELSKTTVQRIVGVSPTTSGINVSLSGTF